MEFDGLESIWEARLLESGWSDYAASLVKFCWSVSTRVTYNRVISNFHNFCSGNDIAFPPDNPGCIADFLCDIATASPRPKSSLNTSMAAIGALYRVSELPNPNGYDDIRALISALTKTHTTSPRQRSLVLPLEPFQKLFRDWPDNSALSLKDLRLKVITLLAFAFMLRPSDIAPKAVVMDKDAHVMGNLLFTREQIKFPPEGGVGIIFHGIKNDLSRDGFDVSIPPASDAKLDPALCLDAYLHATYNMCVVGQANPAFFTLNRPFKAISSSTVSSILNEAIRLAGLDTSKYSAKCFRPTGATLAVSADIDPDKARRLGRWKSPSVFFEHYVHDSMPESYTDDVLL